MNRGTSNIAVLSTLMIVISSSALSQEAALWSGQAQCQLSVQSPGYVDQETQTWAITGCEMLNCDARSPSRESLTAIPK